MKRTTPTAKSTQAAAVPNRLAANFAINTLPAANTLRTGAGRHLDSHVDVDVDSDFEDYTSDDASNSHRNKTPSGITPENKAHATHFSSRSPRSPQARLPETLLSKRSQRVPINIEGATEEDGTDRSEESDGEEDGFDPVILEFDSPLSRNRPNSDPDSAAANQLDTAASSAAPGSAADPDAARTPLAIGVPAAYHHGGTTSFSSRTPLPQATLLSKRPGATPPPAAADAAATSRRPVPRAGKVITFVAAHAEVEQQPGYANADADQLTTTPLKAGTEVEVGGKAIDETPPAAELKTPVDAQQGGKTLFSSRAKATTQTILGNSRTGDATTPPPVDAAKVSINSLNPFSVPRLAKESFRRWGLIRPSKDLPDATLTSRNPVEAKTPPAAPSLEAAQLAPTAAAKPADAGPHTPALSFSKRAASGTPTPPNTLGNYRADADSTRQPAAATTTPAASPTSMRGRLSSLFKMSGTQTTPVAATSQDSQALNKLKGLAKIHGRSYVTSLESQFEVVFKKSLESSDSSSEGGYELYRDGQILNEQTEKNKFNDDLGKFRKSVGDDDYIYDKELANSLNDLIPDSIKTKISDLLLSIPEIQVTSSNRAEERNHKEYKEDVENRLTIEYAGFLSPYSSCQHSVTIAEREEFLNNILELNAEENKNKILKALKNLSLDNLASKEDRRLNLDLNLVDADSQKFIYKIHSNTNSGRVQAEKEYGNFKRIAKRIATEPLEGESKSDKESPTDLVHFHLIDNYFSGGDQGFSGPDSNDDKKNKALIIFHAHKYSSANQYSYKQSIISGGDIQKFEDTIKEKQKYISLSNNDDSTATEEKTIDQIKKLYEDGVKAYKSGQVIDEASQTDSHKKLAIALVAQDFLDCQVFSDKYISKTSDTPLNQAASSQDSSSSKLQNDLDRKFADIVVPNKQYHALGGIFQKGITISRHQDEENNQGSIESVQEADKFVNVVNVWDKSSRDQQKSAFVAINNPPYEISVNGEIINATFFRKIAFTKEGKIRFSENIYYEDEEGEKKFFKIEEIQANENKVKLLNDLAALKIKTTYVAMDKNEIKTVGKSYTDFNKDSQKFFFSSNYEVKQPAADIRSATGQPIEPGKTKTQGVFNV